MNNNQLELHVNSIVKKLDEAQQQFDAATGSLRSERDALKAGIAAMVADAVKAEFAKFDKVDFSDGAGGTLTVLVLSRKPKK